LTAATDQAYLKGSLAQIVSRPAKATPTFQIFPGSVAEKANRIRHKLELTVLIGIAGIFVDG